MEKSLTKKAIELFQMQDALKKVSEAPGFKFQILIAKNIKALENELELIREKSKPCPEFEKAQEAVEELKKSFANRDKEGNPIIIQEKVGEQILNRYDLTDEKLAELETAHDAFWKEENWAEARAKQDVIYAEYDTFIKNEDIVVTLFTIPESCVPEDYFNKEQNTAKLKYFIGVCMDLVE